jgi:hypothetical protein
VHGWITEQAVQHLPMPLRGFFEANEAKVAAYASGEPSGTHFINIDSYPEFFDGTFPRELADAQAKYGASVVAANGLAPWNYEARMTTLTQQMSGARTITNWTGDVVATAATVAHYIEDLHNPLHLTKNFDGQLTGNSGIHARYEGEMLVPRLDEIAIAPAAAEFLPSPLDFAFDGIHEHYHWVDDIMAGDTMAPKPYDDAYFDSLWTSTAPFTTELLQEASVAVASSWYTAWVNAGAPRTFLSHSADSDADGEVDADDLAAWSASFGVDRVGDADSSGVSDGADFLLWQRQMGAAVPGGVSVAEPAADAMMLLAAAAGCGLMRRLKTAAT